MKMHVAHCLLRHPAYNMCLVRLSRVCLLASSTHLIVTIWGPFPEEEHDA